jgi:soluble lytic murein transglycosylase-like protein
VTRRLHRRLLLGAIACIASAVWLCAPAAQADYAVLRSGMRLHITGYQRVGDVVRLTVSGGSVEIAASDLVAVEPEDVFPAPPGTPKLDAPSAYANLIRAAARENGLDANLIARVIAVESHFNPRAVSPKRALGLMQLMPQTAAQYDVANAFDPTQNIEAGTRYLKELIERYRGDLRLALAAYNAGPETVDRYGGMPPYRETENYVRRIQAALTGAARSR